MQKHVYSDRWINAGHAGMLGLGLSRLIQLSWKTLNDTEHAAEYQHRGRGHRLFGSLAHTQDWDPYDEQSILTPATPLCLIRWRW